MGFDPDSVPNAQERILALSQRKQPVMVEIVYRDGEWSGTLTWTEKDPTFETGGAKPARASFNADDLGDLLEGLISEAERLANANDVAL